MTHRELVLVTIETDAGRDRHRLVHDGRRRRAGGTGADRCLPGAVPDRRGPAQQRAHLAAAVDRLPCGRAGRHHNAGARRRSTSRCGTSRASPRASRSTACSAARGQRVGVYASAINLHLTQGAAAGAGRGPPAAKAIPAFKLKVGRADADEDLDRCRAVRKLIGARELMLDANQKWTAGEAVQRCRGLAEVAPLFIEEPLLSDDVAGHAHVRAHGGVPVAMGESALQPLRVLELRARRGGRLSAARRVEGRRHHRVSQDRGARAVRQPRRVAARRARSVACISPARSRIRLEGREHLRAEPLRARRDSRAGRRSSTA